MTKVFVRDPDGNVDYEINNFESLTTVERENDVSSWSIQCPLTEASANLASPGNSIIIEEDFGTLSGPTTNPDRYWSKDTNHIVISGVSDDTFLWERLAYPCRPTLQTDGTSLFADAANDIRMGAGETVMYQYAIANLGGGAFSTDILSNRIAPGISFQADQGRGTNVTGSARFDILGDLLQTLAVNAGGLRFGITDNVMWIDEVTDRSDEVEFSREMGTLLQLEYSRTAPKVTHVVIAGGGDGTARVCLLTGDDVAAGNWRRIEGFSDRRDTSDPVVLNQTAQTAIVNGQETTGLTIVARDLPTMRYGYEYRLGDLVSFVVDGVLGQDVIRQVTVTRDSNGRVISPSIQSATTQGAASALRIFDQLRDMERRISSLERNL